MQRINAVAVQHPSLVWTFDAAHDGHVLTTRISHDDMGDFIAACITAGFELVVTPIRRTR